MPALVVKRWTKHGKDRLYVSLLDGTKVGFADLLSGNTNLERPDLAEDFHQAVQSHLDVTQTPSVQIKPQAVNRTTSHELLEHAKASTLPARTFWAYARREQ